MRLESEGVSVLPHEPNHEPLHSSHTSDQSLGSLPPIKNPSLET